MPDTLAQHLDAIEDLLRESWLKGRDGTWSTGIDEWTATKVKELLDSIRVRFVPPLRRLP